MTYMGRSVGCISRDIQKKNILFFEECDVCRTLFSPVSLAWGQVRRASDNKENFPVIFSETFDAYITYVYYLDRHMNRRHNKLKVDRVDPGQLHTIGVIEVTNEMCDRIRGTPLSICINYIFIK